MESRERYSPGRRCLHWLMALLVLLVYLAMEQRGLFARGTPQRTAMMQSHFWLGLTIFALLWWRLRLRVRDPEPAIVPPLPRWQHAVARATHIALYLFLAGMPLMGLTTLWLEHRPLYLPFTDIALPSPLAKNEDLAATFEHWHTTVGEAFYWVIGLHVLAALYHHFWRRDDTLRRML
ncbi:MAG TPA: cytochrome b [Xanthomonadaceae bacterium]|nr:cytochrome b [Xanthomonadaceae bacterium]